MDKRRIAGGKLADRAYAQSVQPVAGAFADRQERVRGQGPHALLEILAKNRRAVRLFVIAAELGERAVERHADRDGQSDLLAHAAAQLVRNMLAGAEQVHRAGDIKEGFVNAERIDKIGVLQVQLVAFARKLHIFAPMRCYQP